MRRLLVIVLLTGFIPVSSLGYAGFAVLGLHSHCRCHSSNENRSRAQNPQLVCGHHHCGEHHENCPVFAGREKSSAARNSQEESSNRPEHSEECVLCQFFRYAKLQADYTLPPHQVIHRVFQKLFLLEEFLVVFDYSLRPTPRGPPAIIS